MTPFELLEPKTLKEAAGLLDPDDPTIRPIGGGTALMLMMKAGLYAPSVLVSLQKIEDGHSELSFGVDGSLSVGALTPLRALEMSENVPAVIRRTMTTLSNVRVRNVATVGGCLAHGDPHLDLPPLMMVLGASVTAIGPEGEREIRVEDLYEGYYETSLAPNELIATLHIPAISGRRAVYKKVTTRSSDDWPTLGVAISLISEGDDILDASIVISAVTEKPMRMVGAETLLAGATVADDLLKQVGDAAAEEAELISDPQGSGAYKRELLRVTVGRAVRMALDGEVD